MIAKLMVDLENYSINISKSDNNDSLNIQINDKIYNININIFNFFVSSILNADNEIKYLKNNITEYKGKICQVEYKEHKILIEKADKVNIHFDKENFEVSLEEISILTEKIYGFYEEIYNFNFSLRDIDPMYLSNFLWKRINYIVKSKIENVMIDDLFVMHQGKKTKIINTAYYKALVEKQDIYIPTVFHTNHINVSNYERVLDVFNIVKKYNYPFNNEYIIVYNEKFEIRDGQHRASALRYLYGNIKIPIMRMYFDEEKFNKFYEKK